MAENATSSGQPEAVVHSRGPFVPVYMPVDQDLFVDPERPDHRGNCLQAVVASLTGVNLEHVPHFVQIDHDGGGYWENLLRAWLAERGLGVTWWMRNDKPSFWPDPPWDAYLAISGDSPRGGGIKHLVISRHGRIVHDPHPDRTGITSVDSAWWLVPLAPEAGSPQVEKAASSEVPRG